MRMFKKVAFVAAILLALSPVLEAGNMVGKKAPDFTVSETVNEAPALSLADMKGEVVLIKYWGTR